MNAKNEKKKLELKRRDDTNSWSALTMGEIWIVNEHNTSIEQSA